MSNFDNGGEKKYSSEGRTLRPRKKVSTQGSAYGERSQSEHRNYGEHKNYDNNGERRSYGERRSFNGERRSFNSEGGERRSYGERKPYGERRSFSGEGNERRNYGERRSFNNESGERRSYGDRKPYGERRSFNGEGDERRSYGERRNFNSEGGERKSYGDRKPYGERRNSGERRGFGGGRNGYSQNRGGNGRPFRKRYEPQFNENDEESINKIMISRRPALDASKYSDFDGEKTAIKEEIRLNKFIANSGVCSRREADTLIQAGVVTVNGEVVTELGVKINVLKDDVRFNGQRLKGEEKVYIVMNKPKGFVTTASDPHAEKTVMDLLKGCDARVFPVGRLDKATTGVLMFTNDGEMAEKLTHPSYDKKKIYQVILDRELTQEDHDQILSGITLNDGDIAADELEYIDDNDHRKLGIEIHSGKNRIVRRIFEHMGYDVRALDRVYFAGLTKKGLQKGEWRYLSEGEVNILKMGAYM